MTSISEAPKGTVMLAVVVLVLATIRRLWKKTSRALSLVADGCADAAELRRTAERRYPFVGE